MESEIAEERGADEQAQTQPAVVFVVVEKVLAITVVEVQHDELIVLLADAEPHIDDGVEIQVPAFALDKSDVGHPAFVVRKELCSSLENATILENVFVLLKEILFQLREASPSRPLDSCSSSIAAFPTSRPL